MNDEMEKIREQAIQWVLDLSSLDVTDQDRASFQHWLNDDERHRDMYQQAEKVWVDLTNMDADPQMTDLDWRLDTSKAKGAGDTPVKDSRGFWTWLMKPVVTAVAAILTVSAAILYWHSSVDTQAPRQYANSQIQTENYSLEDGSQVVLGALSSFDVKFTDNERRIVVKDGDAFFSVSRDSSRPFVVQVGNTSVRVLGTRFDIHKGPREIRVSVEEGTVEVTSQPANSVSKRSRLVAGQKVVASRSGELSAVQEIAIEEVGSWRQGRLSYEEAFLAEIVADANRYCDVQIILASKSLGNSKLTTSFRTGQCEQLLEGISVSLDLEIVKTEQGPLLLKAR